MKRTVRNGFNGNQFSRQIAQKNNILAEDNAFSFTGFEEATALVDGSYSFFRQTGCYLYFKWGMVWRFFIGKEGS